MIYFTPGPSQLYPNLDKHILSALKLDIPSISHRSDIFHEIIISIEKNLKDLLDIPVEYKVFFLASATEAMERIIENCVKDYSFHLVNGAFSKRFYDTALELKKHPQILEVSLGEGFKPDVKIPGIPELIAITHNETSTGVALPMSMVTELSRRYPESLIVLDVTSSAPYVQVDFSAVDLLFFSVQKGFGLPPGLGVLVVSPRAFSKAESMQKKGENIGYFHSFPKMQSQAIKHQTVETPNILGMYLFEKVLADMLSISIVSIRDATDKKADLLYRFFEHHPEYEIFVKNTMYWSKTVVVVNTKIPPREVITKLKNLGFLIGTGYGEYKEKQLRIANFPAHGLNQTINLLAAI